MKIAYTRPPAKLNLVLEVLAKRSDGYHEIDTIMVAIDLCDELRLWQTAEPTIQLEVDWLPSRSIVATRLGLEPDSPQADQLLSIPTNESNLVHRALSRFAERFQIEGGFHCQLHKRIPAGAGMGGASSDAASALLAAATLCGIPHNSPQLLEIAASIGSDVPFFLGQPTDVAARDSADSPMLAARATGRGENIQSVSLAAPLDLVVAFPAASLSTPQVYANCVPEDQQVAVDAMTQGLAEGDLVAIQSALSNRLTQSAKEILPRIDEILNCMWRSGMQACQLTGSGSACFAVVSSAEESRACASRLRSVLEPGVFITEARSVSLPATVMVQDH